MSKIEKDKKEDEGTNLMDSQKEILTEYLKLLREEIHLRIDSNYKLIIFKLVSLATVSSFFILNIDKVETIEYLPYFFYVLLPLLSIMFDFQIGYNLRWMNTVATFIKDKIEGYFLAQYSLNLYESQALSFNALLPRLVDISITGFIVVFCILKILATALNSYYKSFSVIFLIILFISSSTVLIKSAKGYNFK